MSDLVSRSLSSEGVARERRATRRVACLYFFTLIIFSVLSSIFTVCSVTLSLINISSTWLLLLLLLIIYWLNIRAPSRARLVIEWS